MNVFGDIKKHITKLKTIKTDFKDPFKLFKNLYYNYSNTFLLESMEKDNKLSRYSIVGFDPIAKIEAKDHILKIKTDEKIQEYIKENPLNELKTITNIKNNMKGFRGGLLGYISYESIKYFEKVPTHKSEYPDFEFGLYLDCIVYDRINNTCKYTTVSENRLDLIKQIEKEEHSTGTLQYKQLNKNYPKETYKKMVQNTKEKIKNGEIFQSVISNSQNYIIKGSKLPLYQHLRQINPSPYMYHIKHEDREIIGSSPEMLLRLENDKIETYPIAGTRPRGKTKEEDLKLEKSLLNDEKELAEHLMLVDLARNDVGKISEINSVKVPKFMEIKKFSHVQHIVSNVTGKLDKNKDSIDSFMSLFPAGTLSGAPKIRAMEIINKEENQPRGPYGGAVGYFSLNGNADFAITIRTLTTNKDKAKIQAGAGIVYDSNPESEFIECENKTQALEQALKEAGIQMCVQ
ncbi:MAG: anthranilate synthase component I [Methanobacteriaceae archaeon]|nr:anthranilate synthase component I [Methanobacteriaceae archaeon]